MQIAWTAPALRDLASLRAYVAQDKPTAADGQLELVMTAVRRLADFPLSGRAGRIEGTREPVVGGTPYLVAYRIRNDRIGVLRVLHGRQRWPVPP